jgi:thioredoxin-like negative regulator of GroEL
LAPEYAKAAGILAEQDLYIAKMDGTIHRKINDGFGITSFPTMKYFKKGMPHSEYKGKRSGEAIAAYVIA